MGYNLPLQYLRKLTDEEIQAIPAYDSKILEHRDTTKIVCREHAWMGELCKSLSDRDSATAFKQPWPRYLPTHNPQKRRARKGGEAFLLPATDTWRQTAGKNADVMLKIPWPLALHDTQRLRPLQTPAPKKIAKGAKELFEVAKSLVYRKIEKKQEKKSKIELEEEQKQKHLDESSLYTRFRRAFDVQDQLHKRIIRVDPSHRLGYIPECYEFGFHPLCFAEMEYVEGQGYMDYLYSHNDEQNLAVFLKLVNLIEKILHALGAAHCDLKPANVIIKDDYPILLDFGIIKCPNFEEITRAGAQYGSLGYAPPAQLEDARNRGYASDIFALACILHATLTRREPDLQGLLIEYDDDGQIIYTPELIAAIDSLFDKHFIPEKYREIFDKAHNGLYTDISELRSDLEGLAFPKISTACSSPCQALTELQSKVEHLAKALKGENLVTRTQTK